MEIDWKDKIGKRVLLTYLTGASEGVLEEISPSGLFGKFCFQGFRREWIKLNGHNFEFPDELPQNDYRWHTAEQLKHIFTNRDTTP